MRAVWVFALVVCAVGLSCAQTSTDSVLGQAKAYIWDVTPSAGPTTGETLVTVQGENLRNTTTALCRFGSTTTTAVLTSSDAASLETTVQCVAPAADMAGVVAVEVSLDGVEFTANGVVFAYYDPAVLKTVPTSVPTGGSVLTVFGPTFVGAAYSCHLTNSVDSSVVVTSATHNTDTDTLHCNVPTLGSGVWDVSVAWDHNNATIASLSSVDILVYEDVQVTPPELVQVPTTGGVPVSFTGKNLQLNTTLSTHVVKVGRAVVDGSLTFADENGTITFIAPTAHDAGLLASRHYLFSSTSSLASDGITLQGSAMVASRVLQLTTASQLHTRGSAVVSFSPPPFPALSDLVLEFDCLVGGGSGGSGLSVSFGAGLQEAAAKEAAGEQGVGDGLRVLFRTRTAKAMEVVYRNRRVGHWAGFDARLDVWVPVRLSITAAGAITVCYNHVCGIDRLYVPAWAPGSSWELAFGARTSERNDNHWIDNVVVRSGYLVGHDTAAVSLSLNNQDFAASTFSLQYYAPPVLAAVFPQGGHEDGGTNVTLTGFHLVNADFIKCRFGEDAGDTAQYEVAAQHHEDGRWSCIAPPRTGELSALASRVLSVPVLVSINGRDFHDSGLLFHYYDMANSSVSAAYPQSFDIAGGDIVWLQGENVNAPHASLETTRVVYIDGHDDAVETFWDASLLALGFVTPAFSTVASRSVYLSYNLQESVLVANLTFFGGPVAVTHVDPALGPTIGRTRLYVHGSGFSSSDDSEVASTSVCVVGLAEVQAVVESDTVVLCVTPGAEDAGAGTDIVIANDRFSDYDPTISVGVHTHTPFVGVQNSTVAFEEDFVLALESKWTVVDAPGAVDGPGAWAFAEFPINSEFASGEHVLALTQQSNVWFGGLGGARGSLLVLHDGRVGEGAVEVGMFLERAGVVSVCFRYRDANNYLALEIHPDSLATDGVAQYRRVVEVSNGKHTVLAEVDEGDPATPPLSLLTWYEVRVVLKEGRVFVWWDEQEVLDVADPWIGAFADVTFALGTWGMKGARFHRLSIVPAQAIDSTTINTALDTDTGEDGVHLQGSAAWTASRKVELTSANTTAEQVGTVLVRAGESLYQSGPFRATFDLTMQREAGGFSFSYGALPPPTATATAPALASGAGAGDGLRVRLWPDGRVWAGYGHDAATVAQASVAPHLFSSRQSVEIAVRAADATGVGGGGVALWLTVAGTVVLEGVSLDAWEFARGWAFAFGASSQGTVSGGVSIENARVLAGAAYDVQPVDVHVKLNGRDRVQDAAVAFVYGDPHLTAVHPPTIALGTTESLVVEATRLPLPDQAANAGVGFTFRCVVAHTASSEDGQEGTDAYTAAALDADCPDHACNVTCQAPAALFAGNHRLALEVSYDNNATLSTHTDVAREGAVGLAFVSPVVSSSVPTAVRPGSLLRLFGTGLQAGASSYRCRFSVTAGSVVVDGTLVVGDGDDDDGDDHVQCYVPSDLDTTSDTELGVELTINGKDFTTAGFVVGLFDPPSISSFFPVSAHHPNATVTVQGSFESVPNTDGSTVRCRFGSFDSLGVRDGSTAVVCLAPDFADATAVRLAADPTNPADVAVRGDAVVVAVDEENGGVALDTAVVALTPDQPHTAGAVVVGHAATQGRAVAGATVAFDLWIGSSGSSGSSDDNASHGDGVSVLFGDFEDAGTITFSYHSNDGCGGDALQSTSVPLDGFCSDIAVYNYTHAQAAVVQGSGGGGDDQPWVRLRMCHDDRCSECDVVETTAAACYGNDNGDDGDDDGNGVCFGAGQAGSVSTAVAHSVSCSGAEAVQPSVPRLASGISVELATYPLDVVSVVRDGTVVCQTALASTLRAGAWTRVAVAVGSDGGVGVAVGGEAVVLGGNSGGVCDTGTSLAAAYSATQRAQFGIAVVGSCGDASDEHKVRGLETTVATDVDSLELELAVSLNDQDYTVADTPLVVSRQEVRVLAHEPECGLPSDTTLFVFGTALGNGTQYQCVFNGNAVDATFDPSAVPAIRAEIADDAGVEVGAVSCVVPSTVSDGEDVVVTLSLNGQDQQANASVVLRVLATPSLSSISPHSGPFGTRTLVTVSGSFDADACLLQCKFGDQVVEAWMEGSDVKCWSPLVALSTTASSVFVQVSLNGQTFTASEQATNTFTFFPPPEPLAISPLQGHTDAATTVTVSGVGLDGGQVGEVECVFVGAAHNETVVASAVASDAVTCATPSSWPQGEAVEVEVGMNGQAFYPRPPYPVLVFEFYDKPVVATDASQPSPNYGPATGGTVVVVESAQFVTGSSVRCRFAGSSVVEGTLDAASGTVTCTTPALSAGSGVSVEVALFADPDDFVTVGSGMTIANNPVLGGAWTDAEEAGDFASGPTGSPSNTTIAVDDTSALLEDLACVWTVAHDGDAARAVVATTNLTVASSGSVECDAPALSAFAINSATPSLACAFDQATTPCDDGLEAGFAGRAITHHGAASLATARGFAPHAAPGVVSLRTTDRFPPLARASLSADVFATPLSDEDVDHTGDVVLAFSLAPSAFHSTLPSSLAPSPVGLHVVLASRDRADEADVAVWVDGAEVFASEGGVEGVVVRSGAWARVDVEWSEESVQVRVDGVRWLLVDLSFPPAFDSTWALHVSCATTDAADVLVDNVVIRSHLLTTEVTASVHLTAFQNFVSDSVSFEYFADLHVRSYSPMAGPVSGGSQLWFECDHVFDRYESLLCQFAAPSGLSTTMDATPFPDEGRVYCETPEYPQSETPGSVSLSLVVNRQHVVPVPDFLFYDTPTIASVTPLSGVVSGSTVVEVNVTNVDFDPITRAPCTSCLASMGTYSTCFAGDATYGACATCGYHTDAWEVTDSPGACTACFEGFEISVEDANCAGYCVPVGTAVNHVASSGCTPPCEAECRDDGIEALCLFGEATALATSSGNGTLTCVSPPTNASSPVDFAITLNAKPHDKLSFSEQFVFYERPEFTGLTPSTVGFGGLGSVVVHTVASAGDVGSDVWCQVGAVRSPAVLVDGLNITCEAPDATTAGASTEHTLNTALPSSFLNDTRTTFRNAASYDSTNQRIYLTPQAAEPMHGSIVLAPQGMGAPLQSFLVELDVTVNSEGAVVAANGSDTVGDLGSYGFSVSFTENDNDVANYGESGYGLGIRVLFRTFSSKTIEVLVDGVQVASTYVGEICKTLFQPDRQRGLWTFDDCTPFNAIRNTTQHVTVLWQNGNLSVTMGEVVVAWELPVTLQVPPARDWVFVLGARAGGALANMLQGDQHYVDNVVVKGGAAVADQEVPVFVALNAQQYHLLEEFPLTYQGP